MARRRLRARVNWAMRWGGAAAAALLALALLIGYWYPVSLSYAGKSWDVAAWSARGAFSGCVGVGGEESPVWGPGFHLRGIAEQRDLRDLPRFDVDDRWGTTKYHWRGLSVSGRGYLIRFPGWYAPAAIAFLSMISWVCRLLPRRARGRCTNCSYDLSALPPGSPCPECAAKPPVSPHH